MSRATTRLLSSRASGHAHVRKLLLLLLLLPSHMLLQRPHLLQFSLVTLCVHFPLLQDKVTTSLMAEDNIYCYLTVCVDQESRHNLDGAFTHPLIRLPSRFCPGLQQSYLSDWGRFCFQPHEVVGDTQFHGSVSC
uniref:Uncharacterized protein n=1 Tax=Rousettus aegyptiacus TaxID=9407 RepID=A0A7J8H0U7_ROUAE|nr:hypothetical protein HJG63_011297 [Rousettus aegyptiacus]